MARGKRIILSLSWRDIKSPKAGGAELHTHELLKAIDKKEYRVVHISFIYDDLPSSEIIDGIQYLRHGSYLSNIHFARRFYRRHHKEIAVVLDQCNTWRALSPLWVRSEHRVFYIHQLTREIWHIQSKGLVAFIGEHTETAMLRLNRHDYCITVSESTKSDLVDAGFDPGKIEIIPNGLPCALLDFKGNNPKEKEFTLIYVGRYARYKGIDDTIEAFGRLKRDRNIRLWVVGKPDEKYLHDQLMPICRKYDLSVSRSEEDMADVTFVGFVDDERKYELMQKAHLLICPSVREGWGIIISEAGFLGTPSVVYNSPGLRDAVEYGKAGFLCKENTIEELRRTIICSMDEPGKYETVRNEAKRFAAGLLWENNVGLINDFISKVVSDPSVSQTKGFHFKHLKKDRS